MKRRSIISIFAATLFASACLTAYAQRDVRFTGTAVIYGSGFSTRTITRQFTLTVRGRTSDNESAAFLDVLQSGGQDSLMRQIDSKNLGRFSFTGNVGEPLNAVFVDEAGNDIRVRAIFRRWVGFGEIRRGLRSTDYPFGYVEIRVDRATGRGEGTIFPAARLRARSGNTVEIEDFGTFPGRLMGVRMEGRLAT
ncbi:MAG: hypothetical protein ACJ72Z_13610 [Pyrinomonadaceae bacterium]